MSQATLARAEQMLRIAAKYIDTHCPEDTIFYDGTDCDGYCVADDCESIADEMHIAAPTEEQK